MNTSSQPPPPPQKKSLAKCANDDTWWPTRTEGYIMYVVSCTQNGKHPLILLMLYYMLQLPNLVKYATAF